MENLATEGREQRHISLNDSIKRLERTVINLGNLLSDITNGTNYPQPTPPDTEKEPMPSLSVMLNESPKKIDKLGESIEKAIEDIRASLF